MSQIVRIESIADLHASLGYAKPRHPLITFIDMSKVEVKIADPTIRFVTDFYTILMKNSLCADIRYGREYYDFQEGTLLFIAPGQTVSFENSSEEVGFDGWGLFFHPDLIRKSSLGRKIKDYSFFEYEANEALHLSEEEKETIEQIVAKIQQEYNLNLDVYSNDVIVSSIELFLNYCRRYYGRQFITRETISKDKVFEFESVVQYYFDSNQAETHGFPTVKFFAEKLNLSPNYLSDMLRKETGRSTQDHIHHHLIEKAKDLLLASELTVQEISYELGFEHPPSFTKLFKMKTGVSPVQYRKTG